MKKHILLVLFISASSASGICKEITYTQLVNRLIDLKALSILPEEGEQTAMHSSYDRKSQYNESTGSYENWEANSDGLHQYIRKEGKSIVMAEMEGPGAIVRIWSAMPEMGHVKIYIDDNPKPVVDLPFIHYFDNSTSPFDYPELVYEAARGQNNYIPIPYQKSCKVVADSGWGNYFHFNFISFPKGTKVQPFSMNLSKVELDALSNVNNYFADGRGSSPYPESKKDKVFTKSITIAPDQTETIFKIKRSHAIKSIKIKPHFKNRIEEVNGLRKLILSAYWDKEKTPSVWSPLGDFFGSTPGYNEYRTLPIGMTDQQLYSFWYMPFTKGAKLILENRDNKSHQFDVEIITEPLKQDKDQYARFHAKWHRDVFKVEKERWPDWTLVRTGGRGRYVGTVLHVLSPSREPCIEPSGPGHPWWGEGDEKFFVDGEKFPSTFGTGTEDYFGYAWGNPAYFERAFHSQSMTMNNQGHQTVSRMHIIDNIPFQESFDGYIEKYYPNSCGTFFDCVAYWYLDKAGLDPHEPQPVTVDLWVPSPKLNPPLWKFLKEDPFTVTIESDYENIRYTLDGTEPTLSAMPYKDPVKITHTTTLKAKVFAEGGYESSTTVGKYKRITTMPAVQPDSQLKNGLHFNYYKGEWIELPDYSQVDPVKSGITNNIDLSQVEDEEDFGLEFTGYIQIAADGMYTFFLNSDDGSQLFIDDTMVVDNDLCHAETEVSGRVALAKGFHKFRLIYFESKLYNVLELKIEGPDLEKQSIPDALLFHE